MTGYFNGLGHSKDRQQAYTLLESGCLRSVYQAKISLHFLPSVYWIKNYILFLLAQCMSSVLRRMSVSLQSQSDSAYETESRSKILNPRNTRSKIKSSGNKQVAVGCTGMSAFEKDFMARPNIYTASAYLISVRSPPIHSILGPRETCPPKTAVLL